ncbi:Gfo/Idh/MocA family oxidoreductase [Actinospica sp.]|uniref:Gfo/Idh/MocA family protein n=1 Tax=Actinospica sp. TaxID=1872142 RepID=UPI002C8E5462|nr:Gfo/Idh/MocA family oxidoreductase [Actinospica sp.]HWG24597.1 Gfo/Idh/MocA family oxidoreductase [Actinospica sp.]
MKAADRPSRPVRVGVLGCGQIAQIMHLPFLAESPDFEIVGVCDLSRRTVDAMARRYGARLATTSSSALIADREIEAVIVCSYDHAPAAIATLRAGKHLLVEKPLAFTPAEGRAVREAAEAAGTVAMVGYMKLFDPGFEEGLRRFAECGQQRVRTVHDLAGRFDIAKTMYDQERFDDIPAHLLAADRAAVEARIREHLGTHAEHAELYTLLLMLAAHDLSVVRVAFGRPDRVAYASSRDPKHLLAVLEYADAAPVVFEMGTGARYDWWDEWVGVAGDTAEVRVTFSHPYIRYAPTVISLRETRFGMGAETQVTAPPDDPFRRELQHFAQAIRTGAPVRSTIAGGLADLELATDIIAALPLATGAAPTERSETR